MGKQKELDAAFLNWVGFTFLRQEANDKLIPIKKTHFTLCICSHRVIGIAEEG